MNRFYLLGVVLPLVQLPTGRREDRQLLAVGAQRQAGRHRVEQGPGLGLVRGAGGPRLPGRAWRDRGRGWNQVETRFN